MERRTFARNMVLLAGLGVRDLRAQQAEVQRRLAFVRIAPPVKVNIDALELGLRERGYVPGRDVVIEHHDAGGREDRLERIVAEVVRGKVDILLVAGSQAARAAKAATQTIPIVLTVAGDPLATGLVTSLSRPGGNITGNSIVNVALAGKRLQFLQQRQPGLARVAVLHNKDNLGLVHEWHATRDAGATLGIDVHLVEVRGATGYDEAFARIAAGRMEAVIVLEDSTFNTERARIVALAAKTRLPAMYGQRAHVEAGGLMSYGPDFRDLYRNAAAFVDKIFRGAKPGDLPIEQPTRFELVINLRTAKASGFTIPQSLLLRADEVI